MVEQADDQTVDVGNMAEGGRVGRAFGSDKLVEQASSIEGLPINVNSKGVKELDMRETGFIPPVGVKEKADDIPAMLSNNEFVFTADAVRAAGGGSVNKGAQRMYDLMKNLKYISIMAEVSTVQQLPAPFIEAAGKTYLAITKSYWWLRGVIYPKLWVHSLWLQRQLLHKKLKH